jgi:hypothetical protein
VLPSRLILSLEGSLSGVLDIVDCKIVPGCKGPFLGYPILYTFAIIIGCLDISKMMKNINLTGQLKKAAEQRKKEGIVDEYTYVNARYFPTAEEFTSQILMDSTTVEIVDNMKSSSKVSHFIPIDFDEAETLEYVSRMIADILHDGESKRASSKMSISSLFKDAKEPNKEKDMYNFVKMLLIGMINTYEEDSPPALPSPVVSPSPLHKKQRIRGGGEILEPTPKFIEDVLLYMKNGKWNAKTNPFSVDETKIMQSAKEKLEESGKSYTHVQDDGMTRKISADDVAFNAKYPVEYIYDAGSQLQASDIAKFPSIHISLINFLDQGDKLRDRNQLITALRAYAETITDKVKTEYKLFGKQKSKILFVNIFKDFLEDERAVRAGKSQGWAKIDNYVSPRRAGDIEAAAAAGPAIDAELEFVKSCQLFYNGTNESVTRNPYIFIGFIQSYLESQRTTLFTPSYPISNETICNEFEKYVQNMIHMGIGSSEQYIIHNNNVQIILTGEIPLTNGQKRVSLLDVNYELVADKKSGAMQIPLISLGKKYQAYESFSANNVITLLHYADFFDKSATPLKPELYKRNCMNLYATCMMKFIGDFCQLIYAFYIGAVFGSFDKATVGMAFFIMGAIVKNKERYLTFKNTPAAPAQLAPAAALGHAPASVNAPMPPLGSASVNAPMPPLGSASVNAPMPDQKRRRAATRSSAAGKMRSGGEMGSSSSDQVSAALPMLASSSSSRRHGRTAADERIERGIMIADSVTYRGNSIPSLTYHLDEYAYQNVLAYNEVVGENNTSCINFTGAIKVQKATIRKALIKYAKNVGATYIAYKSPPKYTKTTCSRGAFPSRPPGRPTGRPGPPGRPTGRPVGRPTGRPVGRPTGRPVGRPTAPVPVPVASTLIGQRKSGRVRAPNPRYADGNVEMEI